MSAFLDSIGHSSRAEILGMRYDELVDHYVDRKMDRALLRSKVWELEKHIAAARREEKEQGNVRTLQYLKLYYMTYFLDRKILADLLMD